MVFLFIVPTSANSSEVRSGSSGSSESQICEYGNLGVVKSTAPSSSPNYFFRTFDYQGREYVSYTAHRDLRILDLASGKEYPFRGDYDPVPMGTLMTVPDSMKLFRIKDIMGGQTRPEALSVKDEKYFGGVYQSVGTVSAGESLSRYRMITDKQGATLAEYVVRGALGKEEVEMSRAPDRICKDIDLKLPMLSKDASMISGYDLKTGTTKVWKIDLEGGGCEEMLDLGIGVGKADFSYDNKKLTFHTSSAKDPTGYFENPTGSAHNMNVFVFDMEKRTLRKLSQNQVSENSYYPVFRPDGTIVYSQINERGNAKFMHADPDRVRAVNFDIKLDKFNSKAVEIEALGQLWSRRCLGSFSSYATAVTTALALNPEKCSELVKMYWSENKSEILKTLTRGVGSDLSEAKLLAACPQDKTDILKSVTSGETRLIPKHGGERVLSTQCSICHKDFGIAGLQTNSISSERALEIKRRIRSEGPDKMPRAGHLSEDEIKAVEAYLDSLNAPKN